VRRRSSDLRGAYALLAAEGTRRDAAARALVSRGRLALDATEIALAQYRDGSCRRLDLFVRMLAIEDWAGGNGGGIDLYRRFIERKSAAQGRSAPSHTVEDFVALVEDVRRRGLDPSAPLLVDRDRILLDGMHRLACALWFRLGGVPAAVDPSPSVRADYGVGRLRALGLPEPDVQAVLAAEFRYRQAWLAAARADRRSPA
jgi:hypothetical protein